MKKPVLVGILIVAVIVGVIVYSSFNLGRYRVEVCMSFHGATNCRTARGATEEGTRRAAITNACAAIASGVTDSIACENTPPVSVTLK